MFLSRRVAALCKPFKKGGRHHWKIAVTTYRHQSTTAVEPTDSVKEVKALKTVDDLPYLSNSDDKWRALWNVVFPKNNSHVQMEEIVRSNPQKLYRIPVPFLPNALVMTTDPEYVEAMFRNEGEMPHRPGGDNIVSFLNKKGLGTGLVVE